MKTSFIYLWQLSCVLCCNQWSDSLKYNTRWSIHEMIDYFNVISKHIGVFYVWELRNTNHSTFTFPIFVELFLENLFCTCSNRIQIILKYLLDTFDSTQLWLTESELVTPVNSIKDCSSKFRVRSRVWQTPEEGRRIYRPKLCGNNNKDEDNSPKTLNDKNHQASSQKFRQQTLEEGRRTYRPKRYENNDEDEDNSPTTLNDKNHQASSQKFRQQTLEEERRTYRPKRYGNNNKDEDNSPKTLNDKNHQASSQKFRQQTLEEGWRTYRPKRYGNNNKDEDNSPKTLNDKTH